MHRILNLRTFNTLLKRQKTLLPTYAARSKNLSLAVAGVSPMDRPAVAVDCSIVPTRISLAVVDQPVATYELTNITVALRLPVAVVVAIPLRETYL